MKGWRVAVVERRYIGGACSNTACTPNITLHRRTEIVALGGSERLSRVVWKTGLDGKRETREIGHLFLMTGAVPNTR
jgi:thioredoxin reductase (NADPH)